MILRCYSQPRSQVTITKPSFSRCHSILRVKTEHLPRQARDEHRENSTKARLFSLSRGSPCSRCGHPCSLSRRAAGTFLSLHCPQTLKHYTIVCYVIDAMHRSTMQLLNDKSISLMQYSLKRCPGGAGLRVRV